MGMARMCDGSRTLGCCLQAPLRFAPGLARTCLRPQHRSRAPLLKMGHFDCDCLSFPPTLPTSFATCLSSTTNLPGFATVLTAASAIFCPDYPDCPSGSTRACDQSPARTAASAVQLDASSPRGAAVNITLHLRIPSEST